MKKRRDVMQIHFRFEALPREQFESLLRLSDEQLSFQHAKWVEVDAEPGYPCRVSLADAKIGERVLAVTYLHHIVNSPYRASGPIFVRENCETCKPAINEIPKMFHHRLLSLRGYGGNGMLLTAEVIPGTELRAMIEKMFGDESVEYLHVHNARPGCFNCSVYRA